MAGLNVVGNGVKISDIVFQEQDFEQDYYSISWDYRPANCGAIYAVGNTWDSATIPAVADKNNTRRTLSKP